MYSADYDDTFVLAARSDSSGWDTWQGIIQPYMKNWGVVNHPKFPGPSGTYAYWQRLNHYGVPLRALATSNTAASPTTGEYSIPPSVTWGYTGNVRANGIFGAGIDVSAPWYVSKTASSLSQTQIENISEVIMSSEGAAWDYWWGVVGTLPPLRFCAQWIPSDANAYGARWYFAGPHSQKRATNGLNGSHPTSCATPNGLSTYVATDGSAKAIPFRGKIIERSLMSDGTYVLRRFWTQSIP